MKEYTTIIRKTYVITPQTTCTVCTAQGTIIATCPANQQTAFVAPSTQVFISDDHALVTESFNPAPLPAPEGGTTIPQLPGTALSWETIENHFSINAQPGGNGLPAAGTAPSAVYISRVPWARRETVSGVAQWVNNACEVNETIFGVTRKLMDNAGLRHTPSTDTEEGVDDYNGVRWPFFCGHANYVSDDYGVKHLTAIKGVHSDFDPYTQNVAAFGPAFWFFCCLEHSQKADGTWNTHDGTETGTPLFQLWGISARPWEQLDTQRRAELTALGVTAADFHIWPECQQWDAASHKMERRPYWCHSAYCGGAELQPDGSYILVSKRNQPAFYNLAHNPINALYDWKPGFGGSACVNGFGMLFDIVKNATKNSQSIQMGMSHNTQKSIEAADEPAEAGYIFPIKEAGSFEKGCTVCLWQTMGSMTEWDHTRSKACQFGRIAAIEPRSFTRKGGTETTCLCLVFDTETVAPFVVRTSAAEASALSDSGVQACCYALQGPALAGETDAVIGIHDGSCTSYTNGKHTCRIQCTEFQNGVWMCAADVVAVRGNKQTSLNIEGVRYTPSSSQIVILQASLNVARLSAGELSTFLGAGYTPVCILDINNGQYILNEQLSSTGINYPVAVGGTGSGSSTGHADSLWTGAYPASFETGGSTGSTENGGRANLRLNQSLITGISSTRD